MGNLSDTSNLNLSLSKCLYFWYEIPLKVRLRALNTVNTIWWKSDNPIYKIDVCWKPLWQFVKIKSMQVGLSGFYNILAPWWCFKIFMVQKTPWSSRNHHIKNTQDNQVFICFRIKINRRFNLKQENAARCNNCVGSLQLSFTLKILIFLESYIHGGIILNRSNNS